MRTLLLYAQRWMTKLVRGKKKSLRFFRSEKQTWKLNKSWQQFLWTYTTVLSVPQQKKENPPPPHLHRKRHLSLHLILFVVCTLPLTSCLSLRKQSERKKQNFSNGVYRAELSSDKHSIIILREVNTVFQRTEPYFYEDDCLLSKLINIYFNKYKCLATDWRVFLLQSFAEQVGNFLIICRKS